MLPPILATVGEGAHNTARPFILPLRRTEPAYLLRCAF